MELLYEIAQTPTQNRIFKVNLLEIDRCIFEKRRRDKCQERIRQIILKAFDEGEKQPERYTKIFYTLMPEIRWIGAKTGYELEQYASNLGGHMADWIEQALEWAQRISNGESWEKVCNAPDTANCYRMITMDYYTKGIVGDSRLSMHPYPYRAAASLGDDIYYKFETSFEDTIPLVVLW